MPRPSARTQPRSKATRCARALATARSALLRLLDFAGGAAAVQVLVVAVVAALAGVLLHDVIAAAGAEHAALGTAAVFAGKLAVVAVFLHLHDAVAAVRAGFTARRAAAVFADVHAIVAVFVRRVDLAVTAVRAALALLGAAVVAGVAVHGAVVALFVAHQDAVAAHGLAHALLVDEAGQRQLEVGSCRLPLGVKQRNLVNLARHDADVERRT